MQDSSVLRGKYTGVSCSGKINSQSENSISNKTISGFRKQVNTRARYRLPVDKFQPILSGYAEMSVTASVVRI